MSAKYNIHTCTYIYYTKANGYAHFITHTSLLEYTWICLGSLPLEGHWHLERGFREMQQDSLLVTTGSTPRAMLRNSTNSIYPPYNITPAAPPHVFYKVVEGLALASPIPNSQETRPLSMCKENPWQQNKQPCYARKNRCFNIQHYRTKQYKNAFFVRIAVDGNHLDNTVVHAD